MRLTCWGVVAWAIAVGAPRAAARLERPTAILTPGPAPTVRVFRADGRAVGPPLVSRYPEKMASALDVDGDGNLDLLVLVYKRTRFDRTPGWRPFLYTLRDGRWAPKWLGSRVGHPLVEAALVRTPKGPRLLTIERFARGRAGLTLYHWRGFGFWGEWTSPPLGALSQLTLTDSNGDGIDEVTVRAAGGARLRFAYVGSGYQPIPKGGRIR